jgi:hypothetical protein
MLVLPRTTGPDLHHNRVSVIITIMQERGRTWRKVVDSSEVVALS